MSRNVADAYEDSDSDVSEAIFPETEVLYNNVDRKIHELKRRPNLSIVLGDRLDTHIDNINRTKEKIKKASVGRRKLQSISTVIGVSRRASKRNLLAQLTQAQSPSAAPPQVQAMERQPSSVRTVLVQRPVPLNEMSSHQIASRVSVGQNITVASLKQKQKQKSMSTSPSTTTTLPPLRLSKLGDPTRSTRLLRRQDRSPGGGAEKAKTSREQELASDSVPQSKSKSKSTSKKFTGTKGAWNTARRQSTPEDAAAAWAKTQRSATLAKEAQHRLVRRQLAAEEERRKWIDLLIRSEEDSSGANRMISIYQNDPALLNATKMARSRLSKQLNGQVPPGHLTDRSDVRDAKRLERVMKTYRADNYTRHPGDDGYSKLF
jgi:hypothetical protein